MRVPESLKLMTSNAGLSMAAAKAQSLAEQISTGKRVNRSSDDPIAGEKIGAYKTEINRGESIAKDNSYNQLWLDTADASLSQMVDLLRYAKSKALEAANTYQTDESQKVIAQEVDALMKDLANLANTKIDKIHLYSGSKTLTSPLLAGVFTKIPTYSFVPNWWMSKPSLTEKEIYALAEATEEKELTFTTQVAEIDPEDKEAATSPNLDMQKKLLGGTQEFKVKFSKEDTKQTVINKLNAALAAKYSHLDSKDFPSGKMQDAYFYLGPEDKIGVQALPNVKLKFDSDWEDVFPFQAIPTGTTNPENGLGFFGEHIEGFSDKDYRIRIINPGEIGKATYSVSDDNGTTWSQNQILQWENEIYNPDGAASSKIFLNFLRPGLKPQFTTGLEFKITKNPVYQYQGNEEQRAVPTETTEKTPINVTAQQLFFKTNEKTVNVFDVLERLKNNIQKNDVPQINKQMDEMDQALNQVLKYRGKLGVTSRRMQETQNRIDQKNFDTTKTLSDTQDLDMAKAATDLNQNQIKQQASMEVTNKLLQPGLVQFLR